MPFVAEKVTEMFKVLLKPGKKLKAEEELPIELIQKADVIDKILKMHKKTSEENTDLVNTNGRTLDQNLVSDE